MLRLALCWLASTIRLRTPQPKTRKWLEKGQLLTITAITATITTTLPGITVTTGYITTVTRTIIMLTSTHQLHLVTTTTPTTTQLTATDVSSRRELRLSETTTIGGTEMRKIILASAAAVLFTVGAANASSPL